MKKIFVLLAAFSTSSFAQFISGNDLFSYLSDEGVGRRMMALGYVAGVLDANLTIHICPPADVQLGQARDVVYKWMLENPDKRHLPAHIIASYSLSLSWPCKQSQRKL